MLGVADKVIDAVKSGAIRHFFLIGGCDGAAPGRNYYTDFADEAPKDSVILTLGCGKYRFNKHDFGTIGGIPRLLDIGQCNDAYSALVVADELAEAFDVGVNELPLSLIVSWFEQKAAAVLLTLAGARRAQCPLGADAAGVPNAGAGRRAGREVRHPTRRRRQGRYRSLARPRRLTTRVARLSIRRNCLIHKKSR